MALCSVAVALGIVGVVSLVKGFVWRRRMFGALGYGGPCGSAGYGAGFGGPFEGPFGPRGFGGGPFGGPYRGGFGGPFGRGFRRCCGGGFGHRFDRAGWGGHGWGGHGGPFDRRDGDEREAYEGTDEGVGRGFGWLRHRFFLNYLFGTLDTSVAQEKEIRAALDDFRRVSKEARGNMTTARESVARAFEGEVIDEIAMGEATVKFDATTGQLKEAFETALRRIHAALDPKQRQQFSELLASGFGRFRDR